MELNLYVVNDSDNVINKELTNKTTINISLKRDVDISSPSLILLDGEGINYSDFNYAEISELGRFYLGSTAVILFEQDKIAWDAALTANSVVVMGQKMGHLV